MSQPLEVGGGFRDRLFSQAETAVHSLLDGTGTVSDLNGNITMWKSF